MTTEERELFGWYIHALNEVCRGRPAGIPPERVIPDRIYVLDLRPDEPDDMDRLAVVWVKRIKTYPDHPDLGPTVVTNNCLVSLDQFAAEVVAGPFSLHPTEAV